MFIFHHVFVFLGLYHVDLVTQHWIVIWNVQVQDHIALMRDKLYYDCFLHINSFVVLDLAAK
jgi:hypothetical protein